MPRPRARNFPVERLKWVDRPSEREELPRNYFLLGIVRSKGR